MQAHGLSLPFALDQAANFTKLKVANAPSMIASISTLFYSNPVFSEPNKHKLSLSGFLGAMKQLNLDLAEAAALARPSIELGLATSVIDRIVEKSPSSQQVELFSRDLDKNEPFVDQIGISQLWAASEKWGLPLPTVIEIARPFVELGIIAVDLERLLNVQFDTRHAALIFFNEERTRMIEGRLGVSHLVAASQRTGIPFAGIVELTQPFSECGAMEVDYEKLAAARLGEQHLALFSSFQNGNRIRAEHLVQAAEKWSKPVSNVVGLAEDLLGLGVIEEDLAQLKTMPSFTERHYALLRGINNFEEPWEKVSMVRLQRIAQAWFMSLRDVASLAADLYPYGLTTFDPRPLLELGEDRSAAVLVDYLESYPEGESLDPFGVALAAHRLGIPVPELAPTVEALGAAGVDCAEALEFVAFCAGGVEPG